VDNCDETSQAPSVSSGCHQATGWLPRLGRSPSRGPHRCATVGFGDISAVSQTARVVTIVQMLLDLLVLGRLTRLMRHAVQISQRRRSANRPGGDAAVQLDDPRNGTREE
jgi:Ion channel